MRGFKRNPESTPGSTNNAASLRIAARTAFVVFGIALLLPSCGIQTGQDKPASNLPERQSRVAALQSGLTDQADVPVPASPARAENAPVVPRAAREDDWFEVVTRRSRIDFSYRNGREGEKYTLLESVGGGVALIDFDLDGDLDIFITGGGSIGGSPARVSGVSSAFYRNDGDWRFVDITEPAGLAATADYSIGCSSGDFDRDGFPDLLVTGYPRTRLYRNTGLGHFEDVSQSMGLNVDGLHTASAWADVDNDGWPDLFVTGYVAFDLMEGRVCGDTLKKIKDICGIWQYPSAPDRLFLNRQGKLFEEVSGRAGIRADGKGLGVVASDLDEDGHIDLYVANDFTANHLYLGSGDASFREVGLLAGVAFDEFGVPQGSMGVDVGDFDGDGHGDLFVTNYQLEDNILYRSLGAGQFSVASTPGLRNTCRPYVGFGTGWVDFDGDGWLDLFVLNGHVMYHTGQSPYEQPAFLFHNETGMQFNNVTDKGGPYFSVPHVARGAAVGDLDNDGASDLVIVHQNAPVEILRNRNTPRSWTGIQLNGNRSEPFAVGATVTVSYQGRQRVRHVRSGAGYLSQFDRRILVPTESDEPIDCEVRWLGGRSEVFRSLQPRRTNVLVEGEGESGS